MERINDNMLTTASVLFITALLALILIQRAAAPAYSLSAEEVHSISMQSDALMLPYELNQIVRNGNINNFKVVDLRNDQAEELPGLTNIVRLPFPNLLDKGQLKTLGKSDKLLLIADDESTALMAHQLLLSKGYTNVRAAANDADFIVHQVLNDFHPRNAKKHSSKAGFDYHRFMKNDAASKPAMKQMPGIPGAPDGQVKTAGGC